MRERSLWISTGVTVAVLAGILVLPAALGFGGATKATVVAVGPQAQRVVELARSQQKTFDVALTAQTAGDDASARALVRDGDADVAVLHGARALAVAQDANDVVVATVQSASQAARGGSLPGPLPVERAGGTGASERRGIAFVAVVILYGQLLGYGFWVASGVVEEKSTRVIELLLSAITPRQLLAGKVIGIGVLGISQLLVIGLVGAVIGAATGQLDVTGDVVSAVGVVLAWFVLGFALYSCAFAVAGALVPRQEEIQSVTAPLTVLIVASFFLSFGALGDPNSGLARVLSFVPPSAPMVMPVRMIVGNAAAWQVLAAIAVTLAAAVALIALAARVYGAAVLRTGSRVSLRTVWRGAAGCRRAAARAPPRGPPPRPPGRPPRRGRCTAPARPTRSPARARAASASPRTPRTGRPPSRVSSPRGPCPARYPSRPVRRRPPRRSALTARNAPPMTARAGTRRSRASPTTTVATSAPKRARAEARGRSPNRWA